MEQKEQQQKKVRVANGKGSVTRLNRKGGDTFRWRLILAWLTENKPIYIEGVLNSEKDARTALGLACKQRERGGYLEYVAEKRADYEAEVRASSDTDSE